VKIKQGDLVYHTREKKIGVYLARHPDIFSRFVLIYLDKTLYSANPLYLTVLASPNEN